MLLVNPASAAMDTVRRLSIQQNFPPTAVFAPTFSVQVTAKHRAPAARLHFCAATCSGCVRMAVWLSAAATHVPAFSPGQAYSSSAETALSRLLTKPLPDNVHLLSLDQRYGPGNATVLRLQVASNRPPQLRSWSSRLHDRCELDGHPTDCG